MKKSLENSLNNLIKQGKLKRQSSDINFINNLLEAAKRNFDASNLVKDKVSEAAFKLMYDGLLQIGRVITLLNGYRPNDGEQHKTTFMVAGELLGKEFDELIRKIQKFRIKRNACIYDPKAFISKSEIEAIFKTSREFWSKVRKYLQEKSPQLRLFKNI